MVVSSKRAKPVGKAAAASKKKRKADAEEDDGHFFLASDEENGEGRLGNKQDDSEEEEETADQIRQRAAKAYIRELRGADENDEYDGGVEGMDDATLSKRLGKDADEVVGRLKRRIASRVVIPRQQAPTEAPEPSTSGSTAAASSSSSSQMYGAGRFSRCHRLSATAVALTTDDRRAFSVAKDGTIFSWDVETWTKTQLFRPGEKPKTANSDRLAEWLPKQQRGASASALFAAAVSSDGMYLAVGGGDKRIHVFDARDGHHIQAYPGHKDVVTGLVFREGTHQLLSTSYDRTVKMWSLDDRAYMDSLFGHHAEALAIDILRSERAVTAGQDRTCRVWKIPEESQLVYRPPTQSVDCCRYITNTEWVTGATDGSLQVWNQQRKKPVSIVKNAHGAHSDFLEGAAPAGCGDEASASWVQSVAVCRGTDLVGSGAGDGLVRLWQVEAHKATGGAHTLKWLGGLPARGFVNGLQIARSGRFVLAALGQEPRMGRWGRDPGARNGLLMHGLELADES